MNRKRILVIDDDIAHLTSAVKKFNVTGYVSKGNTSSLRTKVAQYLS